MHWGTTGESVANGTGVQPSMEGVAFPTTHTKRPHGLAVALQVLAHLPSLPFLLFHRIWALDGSSLKRRGETESLWYIQLCKQNLSLQRTALKAVITHSHIQSWGTQGRHDLSESQEHALHKQCLW